MEYSADVRGKRVNANLLPRVNVQISRLNSYKHFPLNGNEQLRDLYSCS